jgi:Flp pilus assembly protein TadB
VNALVAVALGAGMGLGVVLVVAGLLGRAVFVRRPRSRSRARRSDLDRLLLLSAGAVAAGIVAFALTHWLVGGLLVAAAVAAMPRLVGAGSRTRDEIARVEAIASWTEQLRDTMAAAHGLEQAIGASGPVAPAPIAASVARLAGRLEFEPLPAALRRFADDVDHPTCDFVVAGLITAAEKEARDLTPLLAQLATCARDEAQMRARVWVGRARTRTSVRVIVGCVALFAVGLLVLDRPYLEPYDDAAGQFALLVIGGIVTASFVAMDRMGRIALPERFVSRRGRDVP